MQVSHGKSQVLAGTETLQFIYHMFRSDLC